MHAARPVSPPEDTRRAGADAGERKAVGNPGDAAPAPAPRVLQLSKFYPPVMGGIETVAWELTEGLNRAGVVTDVLCSHHAREAVSEIVPGGYRVTRAGSLGRVLSTSIAPSMPGLLRRLQARYDLIHLHMPDPMAALAVWASRPRARLVVHWHSDVIRQRLAMHAYRHLQDWVLARADVVIATSEAYANSSDALRPWRHKVRVVPIGISDHRGATLPDVTAALRAKHAGKRVVFSLGRMTHYKGFDVLIDAAAALPDDCVVLIGGDGELLESLRRNVAARALDGKVQLLGHIPDHELASYFEACDVFCMPSTVRAEAYGVAILEAMVMGKPVVATDIPGSGVPWVNVHGVTGLNVPVKDAPGLAAALSRVLRDEALRTRLGAVARLRYSQELRAEVMTARTIGVYASIGVAVPGRRPDDEFAPTRPAAHGLEPADAVAMRPGVAPMPTPGAGPEPAIPRRAPSVEPTP